MKRILVVAPHPDDETLGVGGTLLKHKNDGDVVFWLLMTHVLENKNFSSSFKAKREQQIEEVSRCFGFEKKFQLPFKTTQLDTYPLVDIIDSLYHVLQEAKPEVVYLPNPNDVHSDHRVTFEAGFAACKSFRAPFIRRLLTYESLSETDFAPPFSGQSFAPNVFTDITPYFGKKIEIVKIYDSELKEHPFPRSEKGLQALATLRGSAAGVPCAEAFMLLKEILK